MECKNVSVKLLCPISISAERQSQFSGCLDYIPGSTLRGALAQRYLDIFGKDPLFNDMFLHERCRFSHLLPSENDQVYSRHLPLTACSCKRIPGFEGHGVVDLLWFRTVQQLLFESGASLDAATNLRDPACPLGNCGQDIKTLSGYWNSQLDAPADIDVRRTETLHTGVDRSTGTVAEEILYAVEAIEPRFPDGRPLWFNGHIKLTKSVWPRMEELFSKTSTLFLGHGRTRGHGEVQLKLTDKVRGNIFDGREKWDAACHQFIQLAAGLQATGFFFSIGLLSDAIVVDPYLRYMAEPNLQWPGVKLISSVMKRGVAIGWNQAHHLPKEDEITISRGSVFLYRYDGKFSLIKERLDSLESEGIGLRRNEGFGQIIISDPFHHQFRAHVEED